MIVLSPVMVSQIGPGVVGAVCAWSKGEVERMASRERLRSELRLKPRVKLWVKLRIIIRGPRESGRNFIYASILTSARLWQHSLKVSPGMLRSFGAVPDFRYEQSGWEDSSAL